MTEGSRKAKLSLLAIAGILSLAASCASKSRDEPTQLGSGDSRRCISARRFATIDKATAELADKAYERQVLAQNDWRAALVELGQDLPTADLRKATDILKEATTTASDRPWSEQQRAAYRFLDSYLREDCGIDLVGPK